MSDGITRRDFLKGMSALGIVLVTNPLGAIAEENDFTIVETIPRNDLKHLESLLVAPATPLYDAEGNVNLRIDRWPEVAYHLDVGESPNRTSFNVTLNSMGNAFLLSNEGFFISAYHVFDDHVKRRQERDDISMMLIYDPSWGFALPARPLIYSKKHDILLGRVNLDNKSEIKTTYISDTDSPPLHYVYSTKYGKLDYMSGDLLKEILHSGWPEFEIVDGHSRPTFKQERLLRKELDHDLGCGVSIGQITDIGYTTGEKLTEDGEYAFWSKMIPGNSGSPVFDIQNRLIGVVTKRDTVTDANTGETHNIGIYTGPIKIQEMIRRYVAHHR